MMRNGTESRRSPLLFVGLLLILSIPFYFVARRPLLPPGMMFFPTGALMAWLPLIIACGLTWREAGAGAVKRLLLSAVDFRKIRLAWYIPVLFLMPLIYVLALSLAQAMDPALGPGLPVWEAPLFYLPIFLFLLAFAIGEEVGWMGYLAGPLQEKWGALTASLVIGVIWAAWHVVPYYIVHHDNPQWILWQCVFTVLLRVLIFWVFNNNGGSLLAAEIVHAYSNIGYRTFPDGGVRYDPFATSLVLGAVVLLIVIFWDPRTMSRLRFSASRTA